MTTISNRQKYLRWGFAAVCLAVSALIFMLFFEQFPIEGTTLAIDWRGLHDAIKNGSVLYKTTQGFRIPPWDAVVVLPLGYLSMRASWGLIVFITMLVLVVSVPRTERRPMYWLSVLLLTVSFPSLRHAADGNFEALVIAGLLLSVYAYEKQRPYLLAAGILLAVAKPQETILFMLVLGLYLLQTFPRPALFRLIGALAVVVIPLMVWKGQDWLTTMLTISQRGSEADMSLVAAVGRAGGLWSGLALVAWLVVLAVSLYLAWTTRCHLPREKATLLVTASLLVAPYASGNSVLTPLAVGIIPLFQINPLLGGLLIFLIDIPILFHNPSVTEWISYYWTGVLLLTWGIMAWQVMQARRGSSASILAKASM